MAEEQVKEVVKKAEPVKKPEAPKVVPTEVPAGATVTTMDNGTVRIDY